MDNPQAERDETQYFINLAARQEVDIWLTFYLDKCPYSRMKTTCVGLKSGHFIVRAPLSEADKTPVIWGSEIEGHFTVRDVKTVFCHFTSRLSRLYVSQTNDMFLVFPTPKHIDHGQRRFSRRVDVYSEQSGEFGIWYGTLEGNGALELPELRWRSLQDHNCELEDLSANGLRLDIPERGQLNSALYKSVPILLRGDFGTPKRPLPLFIISHVVRKTPNPEKEHTISVGCQFSRWCKIEPAKDLAWFKADQLEGISIVAQWISRNFRMVL